MPNSLLMVLISSEASIAFATTIILFRAAARCNRPERSLDLRLFALQVLCLAVSSGTYCTHFLAGDSLPRTFYLVGEICGPLDYLFGVAFLWRRFVYRAKPSRSKLLSIFLAFVTFAFLTHHYAIAPIHASIEGFDAMSKCMNVAVWIVGAALLATAIPVSAQVFDLADTLVLQSLTVILVAAFATEHQLAEVGYSVASWAEVGWALGFVGLFCAAFFGTRGSEPSFSRPARLANWYSLRTLLATNVFGSSILLLAGLHATGLLWLADGTTFTVAFFVCYASWCTSQWLAVFISDKVRDIRISMSAPTNDVDVRDLKAFHIASITKQTQLAEVDEIIHAYNGRVAQIRSLHAALMEKERQGATLEIATKVAHDIRSPLSALNSVLPELDTVDEAARLILRDSIHRIQDIANDLLNRRKEEIKSTPLTLSPLLLSAAIEQVVSERRMQHRRRLDLTIEFSSVCYGVFALAPSQNFKRLLTNLINNAVEAVDGPGEVRVSLDRDEAYAIVTVIDNGVGMSPELVEKLGESAVTSSKQDGNGLGVYQAACDAKAWGGQLTYSSKWGVGTTATLRLPVANAPTWFNEELDLVNIKRVVILDDDVSIHRVWRDKFSDILELIHCSTSKEFRKHVCTDKTTMYLIDFELIGESESGIDLIRETDIAENAVLVTSYFEEAEILNECSKLGVKIIPKALASSVNLKKSGQGVSA